jgi:hypothetical protein
LKDGHSLEMSPAPFERVSSFGLEMTFYESRVIFLLKLKEETGNLPSILTVIDVNLT